MQRRRVPGRVLTQVRHRPAQRADHRIEHLPHLRAVWFSAQNLQKPRDVPSLGNVPLGGDPDQRPQAGIAAQLSQAGFETDVPQDNPQQHDAPQDMHRVIIAAPVTMGPQPLQELGVRDRGEHLLDRAQAGAVLQAPPGKQGPCHGDVHLEPPFSQNGATLHRK